MSRLILVTVLLSVSSTAYGQIPDKPRSPTPTPLYREAFAPQGTEVLLSHPREWTSDGKPILLWQYHKRKLADLEITNAAGEELTEEEILKTLSKPTIVIVSSDGKPVHPYYLAVIKPDTLVIIDKAAEAEPPDDKDDR